MTQSSKRLWLALPAFLWALICFYFTLWILRRPHSTETVMLVSFVGIFFAMSLCLTWISLGRWFAMGVSVIGIAAIGLASASIPFSWLGLHFVWFGAALILLDRAEKYFKGEESVEQVLAEKGVEEQNRLQEKLIRRKLSVQTLREKYQAHVSLKAVADDFASTLSLTQLADLVVKRTAQVINRGDLVLAYRVDMESGQPQLVASHGVKQEIKARSKLGDLFDHWVLKHRQPLLVSDVESDFRFDIVKRETDASFRSLIASPMINEGRLIGVLRINGAKAGEFTTDGLRVLSILAVLASSALTNAILYQKTEELAISDSLTGLYVQRYFRERLEEEHKRSLISNHPFSVLMCDIDHFKQCNDRLGHAAGDLILKAVSQKLREGVGDNGLVSRYGGEEFVIILPGVKKEAAVILAETLRRSVESVRIEARGDELKTTISIGVASFPADTLDPEELLAAADKALYTAKNKGRNLVCYNE
ncbi:MAG: sensor domain-containing diguanylate cyclase [Candidatus Omnitrophica bacterium]|nr:sensor domain-containing diguanylate cyclase [Candidatus Omnitrophota bacterium]